MAGAALVPFGREIVPLHAGDSLPHGAVAVGWSSAARSSASRNLTISSWDAPNGHAYDRCCRTPRAAGSAAAAGATPDDLTKQQINRALVVIASDFEVYRDYGQVVDPYILGNLDHELRTVHTLKAGGTKNTFSLSITSSSGKTFTVRADGLKLVRSCTPADQAGSRTASCPGGRWAGSSQLRLPKIPVLTPKQRDAVTSTLTQSVNYFADMYANGLNVLGTKRYASSSAASNAIGNPTSAASLFHEYSGRLRHETDKIIDPAYAAAFVKADGYYTAANEPEAITTWRDDMSNVLGSLAAWDSVASSWQRHGRTDAQLRAAEARVDSSFAAVRMDIRDVRRETTVTTPASATATTRVATVSCTAGKYAPVTYGHIFDLKIRMVAAREDHYMPRCGVADETASAADQHYLDAGKSGFHTGKLTFDVGGARWEFGGVTCTYRYVGVNDAYHLAARCVHGSTVVTFGAGE